MTEVRRVLTVRNPWAYALIHLGKTVENRPRNVAGDFRGPVAIQAGRAWDERWKSHPTAGTMRGAIEDEIERTSLAWIAVTGRMMARSGQILGVVDLVDVHRHYSTGNGCLRGVSHARAEMCSPWGLADSWHLVFADPRPIEEPIFYRGNLGLQTLDDATAARVTAAIS